MVILKGNNNTTATSSCSYSCMQSNEGGGALFSKIDMFVEKRLSHFKKVYRNLENAENNLGVLGLLTKHQKEAKSTHKAVSCSDNYEDKINLFSHKSEIFESSSENFDQSQKQQNSRSTVANIKRICMPPQQVLNKNLELVSSRSFRENTAPKDQIKSIANGSRTDDLLEEFSQKKDQASKLLKNKEEDLKNKFEKMSKKLDKSQKVTENIGFSFEKIDSNFQQINNILSSLNCSKNSLRKSNSSVGRFDRSDLNSTITLSRPSVDRSQSLRDIHPRRRYKYDSSFFLNRSSQNKNENGCGDSSSSSNSPNPNPNYNPKISASIRTDAPSTDDATVDSNSQEFDYQSYVDSLIVLPKKTEAEVVSNVNEKRVDSLRKELDQAGEENLELKKKVKKLERMAKNRHKQTDLYKLLYERALSQLSQNEAEMMRVSNEIEKINYLDDQDLLEDNADELDLQRDSMHTMISMLNQENLNLRIKMERSQKAHESQLEQLQTEIDCLRSALASELTAKGHIEQEKSREIEQLKRRLSSEENRQNDLKLNCTKEINAAQIRFENELTRQNCKMQNRNDDLAAEVKRLNDTVRELQDEKTIMLRKMCQREREAERESQLASKSDSNSILANKKSEK